MRRAAGGRAGRVGNRGRQGEGRQGMSRPSSRSGGHERQARRRSEGPKGPQSRARTNEARARCLPARTSPAPVHPRAPARRHPRGPMLRAHACRLRPRAQLVRAPAAAGCMRRVPLTASSRLTASGADSTWGQGVAPEGRGGIGRGQRGPGSTTTLGRRGVGPSRGGRACPEGFPRACPGREGAHARAVGPPPDPRPAQTRPPAAPPCGGRRLAARPVAAASRLRGGAGGRGWGGVYVNTVPW